MGFILLKWRLWFKGRVTSWCRRGRVEGGVQVVIGVLVSNAAEPELSVADGDNVAVREVGVGEV